jgi:DNA-binding IclR family transcriptional regulator
MVDVINRATLNGSGVITTETGISVLVFLCRHPHRAVSAARIAALIDRDTEKVRGCLEALAQRGLARLELGDRGEHLYRLSPIPAVWHLVKAHSAYAA